MDSVQDVRIKFVLIAAAVLFTVNVIFDSFFTDRGIDFSVAVGLFHYWALKVCMTIYLLCCGLTYHYGMKVFVAQLVINFTEITFGQRRGIHVIQLCVEAAAGFIVTWIMFPVWLSIRDGTIGCFLERNCKSFLTGLYLDICDSVCETPKEFRSCPNAPLPLCEQIMYSLPIILFTLVAIGLTIYTYLKCGHQEGTPSPSESGEEVVQRTEDVTLTSEIYRHPHLVRPKLISFPLPIRHPQPSSSHVLAD